MINSTLRVYSTNLDQLPISTYQIYTQKCWHVILQCLWIQAWKQCTRALKITHFYNLSSLFPTFISIELHISFIKLSSNSPSSPHFRFILRIFRPLLQLSISSSRYFLATLKFFCDHPSSSALFSTNLSIPSVLSMSISVLVLVPSFNCSIRSIFVVKWFVLISIILSACLAFYSSYSNWLCGPFIHSRSSQFYLSTPQISYYHALSTHLFLPSPPGL